MPHTIFTEPQLAGVGVMEDGLAAPDDEMLGAHAIGYEASSLLREAVPAMRTGVTVIEVANTIHPYPTLRTIVESAFQVVTA